jgi:hypothetical protein
MTTIFTLPSTDLLTNTRQSPAITRLVEQSLVDSCFSGGKEEKHLFFTLMDFVQLP